MERDRTAWAVIEANAAWASGCYTTAPDLAPDLALDVILRAARPTTHDARFVRPSR